MSMPGLALLCLTKWHRRHLDAQVRYVPFVLCTETSFGLGRPQPPVFLLKSAMTKLISYSSNKLCCRQDRVHMPKDNVFCSCAAARPNE